MAGLGTGIPWWRYALTQCGALARYLRLCFWPHPLVVDYGTHLAGSLPEVAGPALLVLFLAGVTAWALVRRPAWGFLGAWFFLILAPSSSILPLASQTMAEHRMYLPLAAVVTAAVLGLRSLLGPPYRVVAALVILAGGLTAARRNWDYRSALVLWSDTVKNWPGNARAENNLGIALAAAGRLPEAVAHDLQAARLKPADAEIRSNLGYALFQSGRTREAMAQYQAALVLKPDSVEAHNNLGLAWFSLGDVRQALPQYEAARRLDPQNTGVLDNLGNALLQSGRAEEALRCFRQALAAGPGPAILHYDFARALAPTDEAAAEAQYRQALALDPNLVEAHNNLGSLLARQGRLQEATGHFEAALRLDPDDPNARQNLALIEGRTGSAR